MWQQRNGLNINKYWDTQVDHKSESQEIEWEREGPGLKQTRKREWWVNIRMNNKKDERKWKRKWSKRDLKREAGTRNNENTPVNRISVNGGREFYFKRRKRRNWRKRRKSNWHRRSLIYVGGMFWRPCEYGVYGLKWLEITRHVQTTKEKLYLYSSK